MSVPYNRAEILKAAHFMRRWRLATARGAYREIFARELAAEWKKAKAARARLEQNTGLPVRTCPADVTPRPMRPTFRQYGSARLYAGPGAFEAAIADTASRATASFTRARAAGRRSAQWI
jgi:hypothetical protein